MSFESTTTTNSQQDSTTQGGGHLIKGQISNHNLLMELQWMESSLYSSIISMSDLLDQLSETIYGPPCNTKKSSKV